MVKQVEDVSTKEMELLGKGYSYLVITTTKKGFREFKTNRFRRTQSTWDSRIERAQEFAVQDLEECLRFASSRRHVSVALVTGAIFIVLNQSPHMVEYGAKRMSMKRY